MCCCSDREPTEPVGTSWQGRARTWLAWVLPVATLALIPKCPACVAAYVLLFTGLGLSLSTATLLRGGLIALSLMTLAFLAIRMVRRTLVRTS